MSGENTQYHEHRWRTSKAFLIIVAVVSLFSEKVLYGFIVPILKYMVEFRLGLDPSRTQNITTALLAVHGLCSLIFAPIIAHFADKTTNRKYLLLFSLAGCVLGTSLVAWTPSVWALFLGRIIQAVSGSATWISSFAMLVDNIEPERKGSILALAMSFVTSGVVGGPVISGSIFQLAGYWAAWSVPFALLGLDFVARLAMVDRKLQSSSSANSESHNDRCSSADEAETPSQGFYRTLLFDPRILAGLANTLAQSVIIAGFDTTLPLYLLNTLDWGSLPVGMMFLGIQGPPIVLGPLVGGLRDRLGLRLPTVLGWALVAPFLWLLAIPGRPGFPWSAPASHGEAIVIVSIVGIGFGFLLIRGAGAFQLVAVTKELESQNQGIFGPKGANSKLSAMMEVSFNGGMLIGPLVSGVLSETLGYYYMNCVMC
ncbi:major facilitator superfamily domain-containing protein [Usnea florida]